MDGEIRSLIPRKTLIEIQKLIGDKEMFIDFGRDENHLFFTVGDKKLVSRVLAGQFPNYEMVIPRDNDKTIVASTRALGDGIRRAAVMSDEKLRAIRLSFSAASLELTASSAEAGEAREVVPVEYEGFTKPGETLLGSDSHTPNAGAMGMIAIGVGGLDVALAMAGEPYYLKMPQIVLVSLKGKLPPWSTTTDRKSS